jgi:hypothetical protein
VRKRRTAAREKLRSSATVRKTRREKMSIRISNISSKKISLTESLGAPRLQVVNSRVLGLLVIDVLVLETSGVQAG